MPSLAIPYNLLQLHANSAMGKMEQARLAFVEMNRYYPYTNSREQKQYNYWKSVYYQNCNCRDNTQPSFNQGK